MGAVAALWAGVAGVAVFAAAASGQAVVELYDNGPFVTETGTGFGGADISRAETSIITLGINNAQGTGGLPTRVLDDFTVPAGQTWNLQRVRIFVTQRQSSGTESLESGFQGAFVRFYSQDPRVDGGVSVIGGDFTTNRLVGTSFNNVYRVSRTGSALDRASPVFKLDIDATFMPALGPGHYWLEFTTLGNPARTSQPSMFPVTPLPPAPNGSHYFSGAYIVGEGSYLEVPFKLIGTTVTPCGHADVAGLGGSIGPDGQLTADDIVAFLAAFFAGNTAVADLFSLGGAALPDGQLTADDVVGFLAAYFAGC